MTNPAATAEWYRQYYELKGPDRNHLIRNPGVLLQAIAMDIAIARCLRRTGLDETTATVLDVGCGSGNSLATLLRLGFRMPHLIGVDTLAERVTDARNRFPCMDLRVADATQLDFPDGSFDLVMEATMFAPMTDDQVAADVAAEMRRTVKPTGFLLLADWRMRDPRNPNYRALTRARISKLFPGSAVVAVEPAALAPPVGRRLSSRAPSLYFPVQRAAPFLVGQVVYLIKP